MDNEDANNEGLDVDNLEGDAPIEYDNLDQEQVGGEDTIELFVVAEDRDENLNEVDGLADEAPHV